jgi:hypothetical protein
MPERTTPRRLIAVAGVVVFTLAGLVAVFALARADRASIRDERDAAMKAAVNLYNIDFSQRSLKRQRLREACDSIDAATQAFRRCRIDALAQAPSLPSYPAYRAGFEGLSAAHDAKWHGRKLAWGAMGLMVLVAGAVAAALAPKASVFTSKAGGGS